MENIFASKLEIESVGNLKNIEIPLSQVEKKHLILTGKNGSGKTRVLQAISSYLNVLVTSDSIVESEEYLIYYENKIQQMIEEGIQNQDLEEARLGVEQYIEKLRTLKSGISMQFNQLIDTIQEAFEQGNYVMAYYGANRAFEAEVPKYVEKIELKENYFITESPRQLFIKYLLDLKVTEALARNNDKVAKADKIKKWFGKLEKLLREIFDDKSLMLVFDDDLYAFLIKMDGQETFDFNSLSSGFAAILDIVFDIILRMEKVSNLSFDFNVPGIVLIDEIEAHLHLDMQTRILKLLTKIFPNIQFILTTHSPFILSSLENAVIYDLKNNILFEDGLAGAPYDGIVEGYFKATAEDSGNNIK